MSTRLDPAPVWRIHVQGDAARFNDQAVPVPEGMTPIEAVRAVAVKHVRDQFDESGSVRVVAEVDGQTYGLNVRGDGTVTDAPVTDEDTRATSVAPAGDIPPAPVADLPRPSLPDPQEAPHTPSRRAPVEVDPDVWERVVFAPETRQQARARAAIPEPVLRATPTGWGKVTARLFGAQPQPTEADRRRYEDELREYQEAVAQFDDELAVAHRFIGPHVVAVANGKGGAGKTPFALMLSAVLGRHGSLVATLDNNETRGTAADRTAQAGHHASVRDLLSQYDRLTDARTSAADLAEFSHHQADDRFDVFASVPDEMDVTKQLDGDQLGQVMEVLRRFYHYVVIDSGNNQSGSNWLRMAAEADVMVVPMAAKDDHVKNAKRLLRDLARHDQHGRDLARRAVVVVTQASPAQDVAGVAEQFVDLARHVVTVDYDPAMELDWLRFDCLAPRTQRRLVQLGAAVVETIEAADRSRQQ